ncbi:MAG: helix-turn-helix domain-containing protein [Alcanivoracaceae bacterium]
MPRKRLDQNTLPLDVVDQLSDWGSAIRAQRMQQQLTVREFSRRLDVSVQTLSRIESGDGTVQTGSFLAALWTLGLLDRLVPPVPESLRLSDSARRRRVRHRKEDDHE